jgi:hypothetical protein
MGTDYRGRNEGFVFILLIYLLLLSFKLVTQFTLFPAISKVTWWERECRGTRGVRGVSLTSRAPGLLTFLWLVLGACACTRQSRVEGSRGEHVKNLIAGVL